MFKNLLSNLGLMNRTYNWQGLETGFSPVRGVIHVSGRYDEAVMKKAIIEEFNAQHSHEETELLSVKILGLAS